MLEPDLDKRPDIFQVSHVAFTISQKRCPVKNYLVNEINIIFSNHVFFFIAILNLEFSNSNHTKFTNAYD